MLIADRPTKKIPNAIFACQKTPSQTTISNPTIPNAHHPRRALLRDTMDASALLTSQGWRGKGHSLHKTDNSIGLAKPLLLNRKDNTKGLGTTPHFTSDQWWMNAFDEQLKGLDTSKEGKVTQTVKTGKLNAIEKGSLGKYSLYTSFVRGGFLEGTLPTSESSSDAEGESGETPGTSQPEAKTDKRARKEERRRLREEKAARRKEKEEKRLKKEAKRQKEEGASIEARGERTTRREERRRLKKDKVHPKAERRRTKEERRARKETKRREQSKVQVACC
ncbi:DNA-directed RNA polymerase II subunit RPB1 [Metarhizium acridum CQMa 102]|uniref:DNA-directed RNA polymerase II subunit RPB1 n=1 Tax=Metarhizium acridum (strain CQMa 102) TaxID=655827 RepID=E9EC07_METAQ|nr:DNA-directed RNA polymerase II subunit RPB1 [Metarhizium acridum CQMa 102]EFY86543.1 DNA-directed RNA polymerase II subunit RPB1 [Metarhizium acridum CQMa 102]